MKLGIIRCMQTEDYCPGSRDFRTIRERKGAFMGEDDIQLVGFINCGGCPGKKAVLRARSLVEQGAAEKDSGRISGYPGHSFYRYTCLGILSGTGTDGNYL